MSREDEPVLPVVQGDWVARDGGGGFEVARVRQSYFEDGRVYADLVPYSLTGENLKRVSPIEGGPTSFEPWCQITDNGWQRIERPDFPLRRVTMGDSIGDGKVRLSLSIIHDERGGAKLKASRTQRRKQSQDYPRDRVRILQIPGQPSNKAEMEIAALRRSAQEFRDEARRSGRIVGDQAVAFMRQRAAVLEAEAAKLEQTL